MSVIRFLILGLIFSSGVTFASEESTVTLDNAAKTEEEVEVVKPWSIKRFDFFAHVFPLPALFEENFGASIEYKAAQNLGFWITQEREVSKTNNAFDFTLFREESRFTRTNFMTGSRYYFSKLNEPGFFANVGYKWSNIVVYHKPALLSGVPVDKKIYSHGPLIGFGYRYQQHAKAHWKFELGVNLEPGDIRNVKYVGDEFSILAATKAHLEVEERYYVFGEARIGYSF